jgi:hypothetical protein
MENDISYYEMMAARELDLAKLETDLAAKTAHLNLAAKYAALADSKSQKLFR